MVCGCPERARRKHQITVAANGDRKTAVLAVRQRGTDRRARQVSESIGTRITDVLMVLRGGPELLRPIVLKHRAVTQRPIFVSNLLVDFRAQPRSCNRLRRFREPT